MQKEKHRIIFHLIVGGLLMMVYPWESLFSGNQNVYFLWAAASSGFGHLSADPLLAQADPFPLFTVLATFVFKFLPIGFFQIIYWLINAIYSYSLFGIADRFTGIYIGVRTTVLFTILFLTAHSTELWGTFFSTVTNLDLRWMWDSGMAEQGVLRGYLQPSVFGVFLLLGVYQFLQKNIWMGALAMAVAGAFHANYLALELIALCFFFLFRIISRTFKKQEIGPALLFVFATAPYLFYVAHNFMGGSTAEIQEIVTANISGHAHFDPHTWVNAKTLIQFLLFTVFLFMFRKHKLGKWIIGTTLLVILLSVFALFFPETPLTSITPWRVTIVLFPMANAILIALLTQSLRPGKYVPFALIPISSLLVALLYFRIMGSANPEFIKMWRTLIVMFLAMSFLLAFGIRKIKGKAGVFFNNTIGLGLLLLLMATGWVGKWTEWRTLKQKPWHAAMLYARGQSQHGNLYLVPPNISGFRLNAQVAVFSDQLLVHGATLADQYKRKSLSEKFYSGEAFNKVSAKKIFKNLPITHVLISASQLQASDNAVYKDSEFAIITLN